MSGGLEGHRLLLPVLDEAGAVVIEERDLTARGVASLHVCGVGGRNVRAGRFSREAASDRAIACALQVPGRWRFEAAVNQAPDGSAAQAGIEKPCSAALGLSWKATLVTPMTRGA